VKYKCPQCKEQKFVLHRRFSRDKKLDTRIMEYRKIPKEYDAAADLLKCGNCGSVWHRAILASMQI